MTIITTPDNLAHHYAWSLMEGWVTLCGVRNAVEKLRDYAPVFVTCILCSSLVDTARTVP